MIGKKITKGQRVITLAEKKKSIWHTRWQRTCPAIVLANMPYTVIVNYIRLGWLYEYTPKRK
jgi:hypothetical protein